MPAFAFGLLLSVLQATALRADSTKPYSHDQAPRIQAARATSAIRVDGRLDEAAWATATPATTFTQLDPAEGAPATERTEVRVLVDEDALYVGARLFERDPRQIRSQLGRRDDRIVSDVFIVTIDSYHDHRTAFVFRIGVAGAIRDAAIGSDGQEDDSWDAVWQSATSVDPQGWTAELRIPLSQLRYNRGNDTWGIQFERYSWGRAESDLFAFTPKREFGGVSRFGHLVGLGDLPPPTRLQLLPYARTRAEYLDIAAADPFRTRHDYFAAVGADAKYAVSSDLTLSATVNPDFGQVEVDPAVVNLTAFETFFPEKRPFFVEGKEIFDYGQLHTFNSYSFPRLFHSRRVGRSPQRQLFDEDPARYQFVDEPDETTILAAAKLTGKTRRGWSVGVLDAATDRERGRFLDTLDLRGATTVEPLTNYFVARPRHDFRGGATVLGGIATAVDRRLDTPTLDSAMRSDAWVAGADLSHSWADRSWWLDASLAGSLLRGSRAAMLGTQRSSTHFFQRPDREHFHVDSARTELAGLSGQLAVTKISGRHWLGNLAYQDVNPAFDVNDVGFQTGSDRRAVSTALAYKEDRPGRIVRNYFIEPFTNHSWNYDGDVQFDTYALFAIAELTNFWDLTGRVDFSRPAFDDRLTRGGPTARVPQAVTTTWFVATDRRRSTTAGVNLVTTRDRAGGRRDNVTLQTSTRPTPTLVLGFNPSVDRLHAVEQAESYVTTVDDPAAQRTYGRRYVFATLDQTVVSLETRVDWTFTPTLSFQLYAQPFVAAGAYTHFKELAAARTRRYAAYCPATAPCAGAGTIRDSSGTYVVDPDGAGPAPRFTFDNPDFNVRSLRGNAVLRWEYRPGSTLFLVWQQRRNEDQSFGDFGFRRDFGALFRRRPENVFVVKATYWLAR
jgi:Domain of unknown function (DUF5916)/Carbohydrate family 9 binding domain-like